MKTIRLLLISLALVSLCRAAAPDYDDWMKTFYRTDDVGQFDGFWRMAVAKKLLEDKNAQAPIVGFVSQVLHRHPDLIAGRVDDLKGFAGVQQPAVESLLWYSDTDEARALLKQNGLTKWLRQRPPAVGTRPIKAPGDLDFCWGYFFATGDVTALDPIISALDFGKYAGALDRYETSKKTAEDQEAAYKESMFKAAMWSLEVNGRGAPRIVEHLEKVLANEGSSGDRRLWLGVILSKLKPEKYRVEMAADRKATVSVRPDAAAQTNERAATWRERDGKPAEPSDARKSVGGFGAAVVVTADPDWAKKWNTPPEVAPRFSETHSLRVGERVTLLVFFANPLVDKDGEADVTYDVTIRRPNGRVTTETGLKGMKGRPGRATNTYLTEAIMGFVGEADDPLGVWKFDVTVRDAVRHVAVPLKTAVTLEAANAAPAAPSPVPGP